jgi:hypothetical protein
MYNTVEILYNPILRINGLAGKWAWKIYRLKIEFRIIIIKLIISGKRGPSFCSLGTSSTENLNIPNRRKLNKINKT